MMASVYVLEGVLVGGLEQFLYQFRNDFGLEGALDLTAKWGNILALHRLFFHDLGSSSLSVVCLASVLYWLAHRPHGARNVTAEYLMWLLVAFTIVNNKASAVYFLLFLPWMALLSAEVWAQTAPPSGWSKAAIGLLGAYALSGVVQDVRIIRENVASPTAVEQSERVLRQLRRPSGRLIAPMYFIFRAVPDYRVMGLTRFDHHDRTTGAFLGFEGVFDVAAREDVDAVIFDRKDFYKYLALPAQFPNAVAGYRRTLDDPRFAVYERP
jgi:hypothetical protein